MLTVSSNINKCFSFFQMTLVNFSLNRSFVLILSIHYIAHYRASKVIRKHTKLNRPPSGSNSVVPRYLLPLNEFDGSSTISLPSNDFHGSKIIWTLQGLHTQNDPLQCSYYIIEMYQVLMEDFTPLNKVETKLLP